MKIAIIMSLLVSTLAWAERGTISSEKLTEAEIDNLKGVYTNSKGFSVEVKIEKPNGQLSLFEAEEYDVEVSLDEGSANYPVYFSYGSPYIDIDDKGNVSMGISADDCDNPGCENTRTELTFTKKRNGTYSLVVEVEIEQYIDPGDGYEDDEIDDEICESYLGDNWVTGISYEGYGMCSGFATYYMKK